MYLYRNQQYKALMNEYEGKNEYEGDKKEHQQSYISVYPSETVLNKFLEDQNEEYEYEYDENSLEPYYDDSEYVGFFFFFIYIFL